MRFRTTTLLPSALALALLLAGCGDDTENVAVTGADQTTTTTVADDDGDDETTTTTAADDDGSGTASGSGGATGSGDGTDGDDGDASADDGQIVLSDVAIGREGDVERVVFEFEGGEAPTHEVRWVERPILSAGEGAEVEVDGEAILEIAMYPASPVRFDGEDVEEVYTGGDVVQGAGGVVHEAVMFGAFEARLEWAIGLRREVPYTVTQLTDPTRVVVQFDAAG